MWKKLYLLACLGTLLSLDLMAQDTIAKQNFEGNNAQWAFVEDPAAYNVSGDIWGTVTSLGDIYPFDGFLFWGIQDLDNNNGGGNFFHTIQFSEIDLSGYANNSLSLHYNVIAFDAGDKMHLDILLNGIPETIEILNGASGGVSSNGWEKFTYHIPDTVNTISVILKAKQNGGTDQAGWDEVMITGYPEGSLPLSASFSPDKSSCFCHDTIKFNNQTWGGSSPYLFYWDFDDDGMTDDTAANPSHSYLSPGIYSPKLFVEDSEGDTSSMLLNDFIEVITFPNAWINEIHYDDNSKDTNEGVEIIIFDAPEYDLSNFCISLYNGNNGTVYKSETLDNFIVGDTIDEKYLFYHFFSSMQNGAPDGVALDYSGNLITFLSYEGSFEAMDGPASGETSIDIEVQENSATPTGTSIQLIGVGNRYSHFQWISEITETFGHCNQDQYLSWAEQTTWNGNSSNWLCPDNWDNGMPGPGTQVLLDTGASEYPELTQNTWCRSLIINDGGYLYDTAEYLQITETITVNKQLSGGVITDDPENAIYHFLGSPVQNCKAIQALPPDAYVRKYDEATQSWVNITGNDILTPGTGYSVYLPSVSNQIIFTDSCYNSSLSLQNLSLSGDNESYSGFHLMSNPFLAPIDWDLLPKENIAQTVYVWYNGDYIEWNGIVGNLTDGIIPVAQGFFIQVTDENNSIEFPRSALTPMSSSILKEKENNALEIQLHYSDREDNAFLAFADDATSGFDPQYDALKLNSQTFHPGICIIENDIHYAICFTPVDTSADFCLGFKAPEAGEYTFMFSGMDFINENNIYLKDNYTNKLHDLKENPVIDFLAEKGEFDDRFLLTQNPVGLQNHKEDNTTIIQQNRELIIKSNNKAEMILWDIDGRIIRRELLLPGTNKARLNPGIYILNIQDITKKIIVI